MADWSPGRWSLVAVPVTAVLTVSAAYLWTHPYPALAGGLYLSMAEAVVDNGYRLPATVAHYTSDGLPFSYPPLVLYAAAATLDAGGSPLAVARYGPVVPLALAAAALYYLGTRLLGRHDAAALAAVAVVTSPSVLQYTVSAGGFVRAGALLFAVLGLITGLRVFRERADRWVVPSALLFGATVLSHPKYGLFFAVSYLVFYGWFDRSLAGLLRGAVVALGGALVAAPWWWLVARRHGAEIFLRPMGTHGGVGSISWVSGVLAPQASPMSLWPALVAVAGVYVLARQRLFLPVWFGAVGVVVGNDEHLAVVGALLVATLVFEGVVPSLPVDWSRLRQSLPRTARLDRVRALRSTGRSRPTRPARTSDGGESRFAGLALPSPAVVFVALLATYGVASATVYVAEAGAADDFTTFVDDDDVEAMAWAKAETERDASFVVVGDAAEWFPLYANRTSLVAARGSEWSGDYGRLLRDRRRLSGCLSPECVSTVLNESGHSPDYLYLARDGYHVDNNPELVEQRWRTLRPRLADAGYDLVFENDGAAVYRCSD